MEKTNNKEKKKKEKEAMHFTAAFVLGTYSSSRFLRVGQGETFSSEPRKHSHIIKITVVCTLQKKPSGANYCLHPATATHHDLFRDFLTAVRLEQNRTEQHRTIRVSAKEVSVGGLVGG